MGILNVTPDSFSDGGSFLDPTVALNQALLMREAGATIIDVGPESTRPGADPVPTNEQIRRATPVIAAIREADADVGISIDTRSAEVAREAIAAGATMINDVSALRDDPEMAQVAADAGVDVVLMHRKGTPADMQAGGGPHYDNLFGEITTFFEERIRHATGAGIARERVILDPGIGFGKRREHNLLLLRHLDRFSSLGQPLLVGASRKRFIGSLLNIETPAERVIGSVACALLAAQQGAAILRVHDVKETAQALKIWQAIRHAGE